MRQLLEKIQRLEANQESMARERRSKPQRDTRHHMHYGSYKDEHEEWRVHHAYNRRLPP